MSGAYDGLRTQTRAAMKPDDEMPPKGMPEGDPEEDEDEAKSKKKDDNMTDTITAEAMATAVAQAKAEAGARYATVLASEHYAGRESLAADMLANDKLSADEIVGFLAKAGTPAAGASGGETAALAEMKGALAANQNSNIAADDGAPKTAADDDGAAGWKKAADRINAMN